MNNGLEIRWHGRGGQGAKTAALLLADVAFKTGQYVQGFPEYGPERMGAPITAYNRISKDVIRVHSNIYTPDLVVVVDETLLHSVDVTAGLKEEGAIIHVLKRKKKRKEYTYENNFSSLPEISRPDPCEKRKIIFVLFFRSVFLLKNRKFRRCRR